MKYSVDYGVNESHLTEFKFFELYRDAIKFYDSIGGGSLESCVVLYKNNYDKDGYMESREPKKAKCAEGDNTRLMNYLLKQFIASQAI